MKKVFIYIALIIAAATTILIQASIIKKLRLPKPTVIVRDTTWMPGKDTTIYKPGKVITKDTTIYVPVPQDVDTLEILKAYFAKNIYIDTLQLGDSLGRIIVLDTISQNKILGRKYDAKVREKLITETITTYQPYIPVIQVYIGADINYVNKDMQFVAAGLMLKTRLDDIIGVNAGVLRINDKVQPYFGGKLYWKISFKNKK